MANFIVKKSNFGKGVFAKKKIAKGSHICFLTGKIISLNNFKQKNRKITVDPLQIHRDKYIELNKPFIYFNHSCDPNAGIRKKNELFAIKSISNGEEIFFDYSTTIDEGLDCACGSKKCRKKVGDFYTLPKKTQLFYIQNGAVPDFILNRSKRH